MGDFLNYLGKYLGLPPFELVLFLVGSVLIITVGISKILWNDVERFLRKKGWINIRKDRENEKLDQYLKGYYERQKERENDC